MRWVCPDDRRELERREDRLGCPACGRQFEISDGVPVFAGDERERERVTRRLPLLDELWQAMQQKPTEESARAFCARHGCSRSPFGADWRYLLSAPRDQRLLEIGPGFGDELLALPGAAETTLIVPHLTNARILCKHLQDQRRGNWPVAVLPGLSRLPLGDRSVGAISLEEIAASSFGLTGANLLQAASEWKRVLAPGGAVFVGLSNGLPGVGRIRSLIGAGDRRESLDRLIRRAASDSGRGGLGLRRTIRIMIEAGFSYPTVYAPLPDERRTQLVIPVEEANVARYFLNNLVRKNSALVRTAVRAGNMLVGLGWFRNFVPYYYLIFRLDDSSAEQSGT